MVWVSGLRSFDYAAPFSPRKLQNKVGLKSGSGRHRKSLRHSRLETEPSCWKLYPRAVIQVGRSFIYIKVVNFVGRAYDVKSLRQLFEAQSQNRIPRSMGGRRSWTGAGHCRLKVHEALDDHEGEMLQ